MALWKISVKTSGTVNNVRLEKGMSIEYITNTSVPPFSNINQHREKISQLFMNKYGINLLKANLVNTGRLSCEKIG